jgi:hypothetical protein
MGCVDAPKTGDTSNTSLYVFDIASQTVKVWSDVNTVYAAPTAPPVPDRVVTSGSISNMGLLAWGGMALDYSGNRLYLLSEDGKVVRIERIRSQNGSLTLSTDITTFYLGDNSNSSDRLSGGSTFGQIAISASQGTLYATETATTGGATRIWVVANAGSVPSGTKYPMAGNTLRSIDSNDLAGTGAGVAAGASGTVFGFFTGGSTVYDGLGQNGVDGPRLRSTNTASFANSSNVLIGNLTGLGSAPTFGSLAFDISGNRLYLARQDSTGTLPAVLVFTPGQFGTSTFNQAPAGNLGEISSALPSLRFISHAGTKDWLAGANMTAAGTAQNTVFLWKAPSVKSATGTYPSATAVTLSSSIAVRGLAFDGNK